MKKGTQKTTSGCYPPSSRTDHQKELQDQLVSVVLALEARFPGRDVTVFISERSGKQRFVYQSTADAGVMNLMLHRTIQGET